MRGTEGDVRFASARESLALGFARIGCVSSDAWDGILVQ